jgi:type I restriction enzyme S subunit
MSIITSCDLDDAQVAIVKNILKRHVPHLEVWAFGSRVKHTARPYSDLDLAIISDQTLPLDTTAALAEDFANSDLPWKVDIVDWATVSESFKQVIREERVVLQK